MARRQTGAGKRQRRQKARHDRRVSARLLAIAALAVLLAAASVVVAMTSNGDRRIAERPASARLTLDAVPVPRPVPPRAAVPEAPVREDALPVTGQAGGKAAGVPIPAWQANAVAVSPRPGSPLIAIVLDDMGLDLRRSARAMALPAPLTLSFLSYAENLPAQTGAARAAGHELLVHVPMQPHDSAVDTGPHALEVGLAAPEIVRRVAWAIDRVPGAVGINNHMGSRFTEDVAGMRAVLGSLSARGLLFLDSRTSAATVVPQLAHEFELPVLRRDVFLDHDPSTAAIQAALAGTEEAARRHGHAIAIGHPRDETLAALADWLPGLAARGFALVPVSALAARRLTMGQLAD